MVAVMFISILALSAVLRILAVLKYCPNHREEIQKILHFPENSPRLVLSLVSYRKSHLPAGVGKRTDLFTLIAIMAIH
ncbi:hypothetical protein ABF87_01210 [Nitrosomonas sp. JL21]|nr:hypothetical protein [Nitrosomonas sp. JL21]